MLPEKAIFNYKALTAELATVDAGISPAQAHGFMCGLICVQMAEPKAVWIPLVLGRNGVSATEIPQLYALYQYSCAQLGSDAYGFELCLPEEEAASVATRSLALADWCNGFLMGIALEKIKMIPSDDLQEAICDLREVVAVMSRAHTADEEETHYDFTQIYEFVRVASMLIFHEVQLNQADLTDSANNETVH